MPLRFSCSPPAWVLWEEGSELPLSLVLSLLGCRMSLVGGECREPLSLFFSSMRTGSKGAPGHMGLDLSCQETVWGDSLERQS